MFTDRNGREVLVGDYVLEEEGKSRKITALGTRFDGAYLATTEDGSTVLLYDRVTYDGSDWEQAMRA